MTLLILFFTISIVVSFLCSIWEAVLLSITPSYMSIKTEQGGEVGRLITKYKADIDRPLSAILSLNTIAHTVGAIGVGAQAGRLYGANYMDIVGVRISYESVIAGLMTLAILILSEIIPKTLGANYWRQLVPFTVRSIRGLLVILAPLVWISQFITRRLKKEQVGSVFNRADFTALTRAGAQSGILDREESTIIQNLLRLAQLAVRDVMTPRSVMMMAEEEQSVDAFYEEHHNLPYSRIPVYRDSPDQVTGLILKNDLLREIAEDRHATQLASIRRDVMFVHADNDLHTLMKELMKQNEHLAIVSDDFGSIVGLVTMEDVFETLLGLEIVDESDSIEDLQEYARRKWEERARRFRTIERTREPEDLPDQEQESDKDEEEHNPTQ